MNMRVTDRKTLKPPTQTIYPAPRPTEIRRAGSESDVL